MGITEIMYQIGGQPTLDPVDADGSLFMSGGLSLNLCGSLNPSYNSTLCAFPVKQNF